MYLAKKTFTVRFGDKYYKLVRGTKVPDLPKELEKILLTNKDIYTVGPPVPAAKPIKKKSKVVKEKSSPTVVETVQEIIPEETFEIKEKDKKSHLTLWEEVSDE